MPCLMIISRIVPLTMTINEVITKNYKYIRSLCRYDKDRVVEEGKTPEDIFQDVMITCCNKFPDDVDEDEALRYIKKTLLSEMHFSFRRKKRDILLITDSDFSNIPDNQ